MIDHDLRDDRENDQNAGVRVPGAVIAEPEVWLFSGCAPPEQRKQKVTAIFNDRNGDKKPADHVPRVCADVQFSPLLLDCDGRRDVVAA